MSIRTVLTTLFILGAASSPVHAFGPGSQASAAAANERSIMEAGTDIAEDLALQIEAPLEVFGNILSESREHRVTAAQAVIEEIYGVEGTKCRLHGVRDYVAAREYFLNDALTKASAQKVLELRQGLMGYPSFHKVVFPSSTPPDPTDRIVPLIREAGAKIKALNEAFNATCAEINKQIEALPAGETAGSVVLNRNLQQQNEVLSREVKQIVDALNQDVNALDTPLVNWAVHALMKAKPQTIPAAQD